MTGQEGSGPELAQRYLRELESGVDRAPDEFLASQPDAPPETLAVLRMIRRVHASGGAAVGDRLGPYRIERELGRGAQGRVYLAHDERLDRPVALKVLSPSGTFDPTVLLRFRREAEVSSRLDHPGICTVYEAGEIDGWPYIAMRYVVGESLAARIACERDSASRGVSGSSSGSSQREARRILLERVALIEKVARALHVAHEAGLVHRDVKPGNILVATGDEPVLCDFGLVREAPGTQRTLTRTGEMQGTPAYMAPEQIRGQAREIDRRTDVYGLGVVAFEYLTGRRPFDASNFNDLYAAILEKAPPSLRELVPHAPVDLKTVIETAIDKERGRRYATARHFADDLRRVRRHEPIEARPASTLLRLRRWAQRRPAAALSLVLAILLFVGGPITVAWQQSAAATRLRAEKARVEEARERAEWRAYAAAIAAADAGLKSAEVGEAKRNLEACDPVRRGWEWHYLSHKLDGSSGILLKAGSGIGELCASPDGRTIAYASREPVLHLWDAATGEALHDLSGHRRAPESITFSTDGRLVASGSWDRIARVWEVASGKPVAVLRGHTSGVRDVRFSPDATQLITSSADGTIRIWDLESARTLRTIETHESEVWSLELGPRGERLYSCSHDGTVRVHDWRTGVALATLVKFEDAALRRMSLSSDGRWVAVAIPGLDVRVLDARTGAERSRCSMPGHLRRIRFAPGDEALIACCEDATIRSWRADSGRPLHVQMGHDGRVECMDTLGGRIVTGGRDGMLRSWDVEPRSAATILHSAPVGFESVAVSPDGRSVVVGGWRCYARTLDLATGDTLAVLRGHVSRVHAVAWSPVGDRIASGGNGGEIRIWDSRTGASLLSLRVGRDIRSLAYSPSGESLFTCSTFSGIVRRLDATTGEQMAEATVPHAFGLSVGFDRVAIGSRDRGLHLLDAATLRPVDGPGSGTGLVTAVAFHPSQEILAAGLGGDISLRDARSGRILRKLTGHRGRLLALAWSPDGTRLLSSADDGTVRLWDWRRGELRLLIQLGAGQRSVIFEPGGRRIVSAGSDGRLRVFEIARPENHAETVQRRAALAPRARAVVEEAWTRQDFSLDVAESIASDTTLDPDVREAALQLVHAREEDPDELIDRAWAVILRPDRTAAEYAAALRAARHAQRLLPNYPYYWTAEGAALFRMGNYQDASEALDRVNRAPKARTIRTIAFVAMNCAALDENEPAARALENLERVASGRAHADRESTQELVREVRERVRNGAR